MIPVSLLTLSNILNAKLIGADIQIIDVTIDSRKVTNDCLFIALHGKHFNAHDFAATAVDSGAKALVVNHRLALDIPQLVVKDTYLALGQLAAWVRQQVTARVVALTGSSGKTSVKEMTASILSQCGEVLYTSNNFNNAIGVPLTLLRLQSKHNFAVIELGATHLGDIAYTSALTRPQSALINNLAPAHIESFGSLSGVSAAKGEIFTGLSTKGIAIINADNNDLPHWQNMLHEKTVWHFSLQATAGVDFFASKIRDNGNVKQFYLHSPFGCSEIALTVPGKHNVSNALAATALAMSVGASLQAVRQGLRKSPAIPGRLFPIILAPNKILLDDSYNANVGSVITAIQVLENMPGYRVIVIGDMAELGKETQDWHYQVGKVARQACINKVISIGDFSHILSMTSGKGEHYHDKASVIERVKELLKKHTVITVLIKGSRRAAMDQITYALQEKILC